MATKGSEKRMVKRAERKMARNERKAGKVKKGAKTRKAIGEFIVQKRSIVPNMITMSNMTMGFFAIILASRGDKASLALAGMLVCIGTLFDAIDGAVARAMHVESPVGVQLDSLADGIAYGIAPAVIAYQGYLKFLQPASNMYIDAGMLIALVYPICAIYRLARFNIGAAEDDHTGFTGLPSPAAGILVASIPAVAVPDFMFLTKFTAECPLGLFVPVYIIVGLLMVTHIDYSKTFAVIAKRGRFFLILTVITMLLLIAVFGMWFVLIMMTTYILIGLFLYMVRLIRKKKSRAAA
jgi:CDP-diacylglycerol---serine O-phosphatidyltransferase